MFNIQISNPQTTQIRNEGDLNLDEAIESIFPLLNEYAFIKWGHIFIPLSYKYDVSVIVKDVISLVRQFSDKKEGEIEINWPSNTFSATWVIKFDSNTVRIEATWNNVLGGVKPLLDDIELLEVERTEFIENWMRLLLFIKEKLEGAGYNSSNLVDFWELEELFRTS